jgi:ubiquinone/menaquinone biosynthesis C-methylase UbiE
MKAIKNWWEANSSYYQEKFKLPIEIHYGPGIPNENKLKLLGKLKGKKVLELGCGGGQCTIALAKKGAKVTAIDLSTKQLKFAKDLAKKNKVKIDFIQGSFQNLIKIKSNSQDIVFSAWAFHYSPNLKKLFKETKRVLKNKGLFVFSNIHPFNHCIDFKTLKIKKSYFKTGKITDGKFVGFEHTIGEIYNPLKEVGFDILEILEPNSGGINVWKNDPRYTKRKISKIPSTIILKARKI